MTRLLVPALVVACLWFDAALAQETPSGAKPAEAKPAEAKPAETKPGDTEPSPKATPKSSKKPSSKEALEETPITVKVSIDDKEDEFDSLARAIPAVRKAASQEKRGKDDFVFSAEIAFGKNRRTFRNAARTQEALLALQDAVRDLKRVKSNLEELGPIPDAEPETDSFDQKKLADGQAEVRRRINEAVQRQFRGRPASPQQMQQIVNQELQKAQQEGLIPAAAANPQPTATAGNPEAQRAAVLEATKSSVQQTFGKGTPEEGEKPAEKSAEKT